MPLTASSPTAFGSGLRNRRGPVGSQVEAADEQVPILMGTSSMGDVPLLRLITGGYLLLQYPTIYLTNCLSEACSIREMDKNGMIM